MSLEREDWWIAVLAGMVAMLLGRDSKASRFRQLEIIDIPLFLASLVWGVLMGFLRWGLNTFSSYN